jgi:hypothetical protein
VLIATNFVGTEAKVEAVIAEAAPVTNREGTSTEHQNKGLEWGSSHFVPHKEAVLSLV